MRTRNAIQNLNNPKMECRSKCTIGFLELCNPFQSVSSASAKNGIQTLFLKIYWFCDSVSEHYKKLGFMSQNGFFACKYVLLSSSRFQDSKRMQNTFEWPQILYCIQVYITEKLNNYLVQMLQIIMLIDAKKWITNIYKKKSIFIWVIEL